MKFYDKSGNVVMEVMDICMKGNDMVLTGRMMGVMITSIYIRPRDLWELRKLMSWSVIRSLPAMLLKGMKERPDAQLQK